jgi:hypothetical protein
VSRFAKNTAIFSLFTFISRLTGLVRVMVFAAILGRGRLDDAYQLANNIPNILYEFIMGGLLSAVFIPVLVREQQAHGKSSAQAWRVANLLLGYVGLVLAALSALATIAAPQIIHIMTFLEKSHSAQQSRELATYFLRYFSWQMFFYGLNAVFMAILNAHEVFAITGKNPLLDIALKLEEVALNDEYFTSRKLYPNVDFYSGLIYQAMGFPIEMFTVLFAIPRTAGWLAHWVELLDQDQKIYRPRQLYVGEDERNYLPIWWRPPGRSG